MNSSLAQHVLADITILIVDDHPLLQEGLSLSLKSISPSIKIHCAQSLEEAKAIIAKQPDLDLILLDLSLPDGKGLSLLRYIDIKRLFIPCLIISASDDPFDIRTSLQAGANGFINKSHGGFHIAQQIERVINGELITPEFYTEKDSGHSLPLKEAITPRQKQVLQLLAEGLPNKSICKRLNLTEHTVKSHIKALFQTLNVHSRTECARAASLLGLID